MHPGFAKNATALTPSALAPGAVATILHDLCQPLTALECSLELALLPCSPAQARTFTTTALAAARQLHSLANQAQIVERLCRRFCSPGIVSIAELASALDLKFHPDGTDKHLYIDSDGIRAVFRRLAGSGLTNGTAVCSGRLLQIALDLDPPDLARSNQPEAATPAIPFSVLTSALVEHLGGHLTFSQNSAVVQFLIH